MDPGLMGSESATGRYNGRVGPRGPLQHQHLAGQLRFRQGFCQPGGPYPTAAGPTTGVARQLLPETNKSPKEKPIEIENNRHL